MTANDTKEVLELIKSALTNKNTRQLGEALVTLTELEPNRWITLLHLNNVIPDADQKTAELAKILPILLESLPYAIADPVFPIDGFTNLLLPLLTLNTSFSSISESLDNLSIWEEPVINLIARIIGFLEDQTDVGFERSKKITGKNGYHDFRFLLSDEIDTIFDGPSTNVVAGYEEHCENLRLIVAYSIYQYSSGYWGEIEINRTPYEDSEFAKLVTLASIWRRYKDLWAKTKYFGWHAIKIEGVENSILFVPTDEEEQIRFEVGGIRAQYIFSEISSYSLSVGLDQQFSDTPNIFSELANSINLPQAGKPWNIELDPRAFREVTSNPWNKFYWENIFRVSHYQKIINWVWIGSKEKQIQWLVYWNLINVLRIIAGILHIHLRNTFPNFDSQSPLHKIILIEVKSLADFFSKTTKYDRETCLKFIDLITFNPSLRYIEIWDTPLIKAGKDLLFFSPALISNGNPVRAAENFISEWNPSLFDKRGKLLEQELLEYLLDVPELKVQQAVKFRNDKFQEIECDLVVWWENTLLLIEVKCRKSIYYPYDAFQAKQQIQKAVDQLVSRRAAVLNSWTSFSNAACDLQLPKEAAKDIKLIAVTNNPHFTGWQIHDVIVTDVFCLKRYFSKNEIAAYVNGETIATVGYIRGSMKPTVKDFFSYLIEPPQVQVVRNGLKIDPLFLPVVKETDPIISSFHMSYTPKSYDIDVKTKKYPPASGKKARRNDPCPCGSGLKYKKCCGSKR